MKGFFNDNFRRRRDFYDNHAATLFQIKIKNRKWKIFFEKPLKNKNFKNDNLKNNNPGNNNFEK